MADTKAAARAVQNPNPVIQGRKSNVNYAFIGAKQSYPGSRGGAAPATAVTEESNFYGQSRPGASLYGQTMLVFFKA